MTRAPMRAGLELLPSWAPEQKTAANRQIITVMGQYLAAGDTVAPMYRSRHSPGWERHAEVAEELIASRQAAGKRTTDQLVVKPHAQKPGCCYAAIPQFDSADSSTDRAVSETHSSVSVAAAVVGL